MFERADMYIIFFIMFRLVSERDWSCWYCRSMFISSEFVRMLGSWVSVRCFRKVSWLMAVIFEFSIFCVRL